MVLHTKEWQKKFFSNDRKRDRAFLGFYNEAILQTVPSPSLLSNWSWGEKNFDQVLSFQATAFNRKNPHQRLQTSQDKIIRQRIWVRWKIFLQLKLFYGKIVGNFNWFFSLERVSYGISPDNPKHKSRFLFSTTKDQTILCVTQEKEKIWRA